MTRRELIMLIAVGTIGVLLISYSYIYAPLKARREQLQLQLADLQQQRERMETTVRQMARLREEFTRLQAFIAEIEAKLPAEKDMPSLLVQLERLMSSLGVSLDSIRPAQLTAAEGTAPAPAPASPAKPPAPGAAPTAPPPPTYQRFPIALTIKATYEQVVRLAAALNDFPRMIAIRNLTLQPVQVPQLGITVDVETYVLPRGAR